MRAPQKLPAEKEKALQLEHRDFESCFVVESLVNWPELSSLSKSGISSVKGVVVPVLCDHVRKTLTKPLAQS